MTVFTSRMVYGLNAVLFLAENYGQHRIRIKDIAVRLNIPQHYLEQILVILKKASLVRSYRGVQGGYALASRPEDLTVASVLKELSGPVENPSETINDSYRLFWNALVQSIEGCFEKSIADVLSALSKSPGLGNFII